MEKLSPRTLGYGYAAIIAILVNTVLTWWKESDAAVKAFMKALTGHHWTTHGIAVVLLYLVLGYLLSHSSFVRHSSGVLFTTLLVLSILVGGFGITVLFVLHSI